MDRAARGSRRAVAPLVWPLAGTAVAAVAILASIRRTGNNILNLIQAGQAGPSYRAVRADFPHAFIPAGIGHDGQQFYAVARQPMHWLSVAHDLDRPAYRLQRPLFSWLAWMLHPQGGGTGLIEAMFVVGLASALLGGIALTMLAIDHNRSPAWGFLFPILPGTLAALRISTADTLAVALALAAIVAVDRRRIGWAVALGIGAVLAKEVVLVLLIGYAISRRDRAAVMTAGCGVAAAAGLALAIRVVIPTHGTEIQEIGAPFVGIVQSMRWWGDGRDLGAALTSALVLGLAVVAVVVGRPGGRSPSRWWVPTVVCGGYLVFVTENTLALSFNGPRTLLPLLVASLACLMTGAGRPADTIPAPRATPAPVAA